MHLGNQTPNVALLQGAGVSVAGPELAGRLPPKTVLLLHLHAHKASPGFKESFEGERQVFAEACGASSEPK